MTTARLRVKRYNPETDREPRWQAYEVPVQGGDTVLSALMRVYDTIDSTLAFRYGCRYKKCGLCAVEVDGRPRLACTAPLRDGQAVAPLHNLPLLRDLAVDRALYLEALRRWQLHLPLSIEPVPPPEMQLPRDHVRLMDCVECLGCVATCPYYDHADESFGGPFLFIKLAQMHTHPHDKVDRRAQALAAGIERCRDCGRCYCLLGLPLVEGAINPLLGER